MDLECPICYEKIREDDLVELTCGHKFHYSCILATFKSTVNSYDSKCRECPYCRVQSDYLELKNGSLPLRNIHREYEHLKGKNIKIETLDKYLEPTKCKAILASGANKGCQCSRKVHENGYCKTHAKKQVAKYMYFPV